MPSESSGGSRGALPPLPALERIATLLRRIDDELATMRHEICPDRLLAVVEEGPGLDRVLGPLEEALGEAVQRLGVQAGSIDVRRRVRGPLHILWADLIEMSPEGLRQHWGAQDVPEAWPQLQRQLLTAVENAIAALAQPSEARPGPPPPTGPVQPHVAGPHLHGRHCLSTGTSASLSDVTPPPGHWPSPGGRTIPGMHDYAGAWSAERGRCHRFVYGDESGHPTECPAPPVSSGWRQDGGGRWYAVDACDRHSSQLLSRPRPGPRS